MIGYGNLRGGFAIGAMVKMRFLNKSAKFPGRDRLSLLDRQPKTKDDKRIPLVLTYHPALNKVYEI